MKAVIRARFGEIPSRPQSRRTAVSSKVPTLPALTLQWSTAPTLEILRRQQAVTFSKTARADAGSRRHRRRFAARHATISNFNLLLNSVRTFRHVENLQAD